MGTIQYEQYVRELEQDNLSSNIFSVQIHLSNLPSKSYHTVVSGTHTL